MSRVIEFGVKEFKACRLIGKSVAQSLDPGADNATKNLWEKMEADGTVAKLYGLPGRTTPNPDTVAWMGDYDPKTNSFTYYAGVLTEAGTPVPDGLVHKDIPACLMAISWIEGTQSNGDIFGGGHDHNARGMAENGYGYDMSAGGFELEYFPYDKFSVPMARGEDTLVMGYFSPCRKLG